MDDLPARLIQAVQTPNILNAIAHFSSQRDLSSMGRTNNAMNKNIEYSVWRTLPSVIPLFQFFSSFKLHRRIWQFKGLPTAAEMVQFDKYATYVCTLETLYVSHTDKNIIDPQSFLILQGLSTLSPSIFPALRTVKLQGAIPFSYVFTPLIFVSCNISSLEILFPMSDVITHDRQVQVAAKIISTCSATLVQLHLSGYDCLAEPIAESMVGLGRLKSLILDLIDYAAGYSNVFGIEWDFIAKWILAVGNLPPIDSLEIRSPPVDWLEIRPPPVDWLEIRSPGTAYDIFQHLEGRTLQRLHLVGGTHTITAATRSPYIYTLAPRLDLTIFGSFLSQWPYIPSTLVIDNARALTKILGISEYPNAQLLISHLETVAHDTNVRTIKLQLKHPRKVLE